VVDSEQPVACRDWGKSVGKLLRLFDGPVLYWQVMRAASLRRSSGAVSSCRVPLS
jgi:hypothetical protein